MTQNDPLHTYGGLTIQSLGEARGKLLALYDAVLPERKNRRSTILSHSSALAILGVEPPRGSTLNNNLLHICFPTRGQRARIKGVQSHLWQHEYSAWIFADKYSCVDPVTAWAQMSGSISTEELVVLGDSMMRHNPELKRATLDDFAMYLRRNQTYPGVRKCYKAIKLMRENTDSSQETRLRLFLTEHSFDDPFINYCLILSNGRKVYFDLAYPSWKVAIEYEGRHHQYQMEEDLRRERLVNKEGWVIVHAVASDLSTSEGNEELLQDIYAKISSRRTLRPDTFMIR